MLASNLAAALASAVYVEGIFSLHRDLTSGKRNRASSISGSRVFPCPVFVVERLGKISFLADYSVAGLSAN